MAVDFPHIQHAHNSGMAQALHMTRLVAEPAARGFVIEQKRVQPLQRDESLRGDVPRLVDLAHSALSKFIDQQIATPLRL